MSEITDTLEKYLSKETNFLQYFGDDEGVLKFTEAFNYGTCVPFESPDMYIKYKNDVWIIEHFEFDSYPANRKGSTYRTEERRIDRWIDDVVPTEQGTTFYRNINGTPSYRNYINNVTNSFNKHYKRIPAYLERIKDDEIVNSKSNVYTAFLIDDVSPLGNYYKDDHGELRPVFLFYCDEFLKLLESSEMIDYVICTSHCQSEKFVWLIDNTQIDEYIREAEHVSENNFIGIPASVVGGFISVDRKEKG